MVAIDRITFDPRRVGGQPRIRGMRVTVGMIVGLLYIEPNPADISLPRRRRNSTGARLRSMAIRRDRFATVDIMRFVVDMNMTPEWYELLGNEG